MNHDTQPLAMSISPNTTVTLGIVAFLSVCSSLVIGTWKLNRWLHDQTAALQRHEGKIDALREHLAAAQHDTWTIHDQNAWAGRLRWENRSESITIPEPREWRDYRYRDARRSP